MFRISNKKSDSFIAVLSKTWKSFWQRTDISGMTNAREAQSSLRKKIWMVLFTVFSLLTFSAMYHVFHDYSLHPVTTSITVKYQNQVVKKHIKAGKFLEIVDKFTSFPCLPDFVLYPYFRYSFQQLQYAIKIG